MGHFLTCRNQRNINIKQGDMDICQCIQSFEDFLCGKSHTMSMGRDG